MSSWVQPVTLRGERVALEPLTKDHTSGLERAAADGALWKLWYTSVPAPGEATTDYVEQALNAQQSGSALPFVVSDLETNEVLGSTRFCNIDARNQRLEIGYTWYRKSSQQTHVNSECKLLLLKHAFDQLQAIAVELRTHHLNLRSRRAIERLGAKQDGILRNHQLVADGTIRDTVVYSILDSEWPTVRTNLQFNLQH